MKKVIALIISILVLATSTLSFAKTKTKTITEEDIKTKITFTDVAENHWAFEHIYTAQFRNIINGYEDQTFKPENQVKVGEFIKMVAMAYWPNYKYEVPAEGEHWAMQYVEAIDRIILNKYNYDNEKLEKIITRAEATRILCVLYIETHSSEELDLTQGLITQFADEAEITDTTDRYAIDNCIRFGLINGFAEDNTFRPKEGLTRAQAAKILCIAMEDVCR